MRLFRMKKNILRHHSIMNRLLYPMLAVLFAQGLLFAVILLRGGTIDRITKNSFDILDERVLRRKNNIETEMIQRWSKLGSFGQYAQRELDQFLKQKEVTYAQLQEDSNLSATFLEQIAEQMIFALRQQMTTGIFIILEGRTGQSHTGLYIRDLDPLFNPTDYSDLFIQRGPSRIARHLNISLERQWEPRFILMNDKQSFDFYYKPLYAAQQYPDLEPTDLGYWSLPFQFSENEVEVITYSIPLVNQEGKPYGVVGIDIEMEYLQKMLPYDEVMEGKKGCYYLGMSNQSKKEFENIVFTGPLGTKLFGKGDKIKLSSPATENGIYELEKNQRIERTTYSSVQYLQLYNSNTPFSKHHWALMGIVEESHLLKSTKQIKSYIKISLIISLIIGIIGVIMIGFWFIKPIRILVQELREGNPSQFITLHKTNILEIDELVMAIESLSYNVADASSKLCQIINMVNIPIGAFEYTKGEEKVFCTEGFFELLGISKLGISNEDTLSSLISATTFFQILESLTKQPEFDAKDIYRYEQGGKIRWIRLQKQENNQKIIGVVQDVTKEVIEKRHLEYERDHDLLTNLLNRRAFRVAVNGKIREGDLKIAAFVMWDLDNLKYINDTYGHDQGDIYIKETALILKEIILHNGIVARVSGDEFYAFIYGYDQQELIRDIIQKAQDKFYQSTIKMPDGNVFPIRASAGIAWYPKDSKNYMELLRFADFAMYEVKHKNKGTVGEFDQKRYNKDSFLLYGKEELNQFIEEELVRFAFQPIVDAKTGQVFGYEALMRPQMETLKSPMEILRLAQSQSKLYEIERITWFKAMETFQKYKNVFQNTKMFINSISNHILSEEDVKCLENQYLPDLKQVIVEIIENEQSDEQITRKKQQMVERWGSELALDDFGSGYNSEIALLFLSPKYVKMDRSMIQGIDQDLNRQKLVQNLLPYVQGRGMKIIAEGIEHKAEMDMLISFGVDYLQGYYLGKPHFTPLPIDPKIKKEIKEQNKKINESKKRDYLDNHKRYDTITNIKL